MPDPPAPTSESLVFKHSYDEVLTALKHQDDKLNRTLTALAFLTAAGVTLYLNRQPKTPVSFAEGGPSIPDVMFVIFLVAVTLALLTALAAIGPGTPLRFRPKSESTSKTSLLYYAFIARDDHWDDYIHVPDEYLDDLLARNLHAESKDLAHRVNYKVARSRESGAFVQLAILSLTLLGIFQAGGLSETTRWWIVAVLVFIVLVLPFWELCQMRKYEYGRADWGWAYYVLALSVALSAAMLVVGELADRHWEALVYALFVLLLTRLALLSGRAAKYLLPIAGLPGIVLLPVVLFG